MQPSWFRTPRHINAEEKVREAVSLISEARTVLTIWEFEEFIRDNIAELGYHGFIGSIGEAMTKAATIEVARTETAQKQLELTAMGVNKAGANGD